MVLVVEVNEILEVGALEQGYAQIWNKPFRAGAIMTVSLLWQRLLTSNSLKMITAGAAKCGKRDPSSRFKNVIITCITHTSCTVKWKLHGGIYTSVLRKCELLHCRAYTIRRGEESMLPITPPLKLHFQHMWEGQEKGWGTKRTILVTFVGCFWIGLDISVHVFVCVCSEGLKKHKQNNTEQKTILSEKQTKIRTGNLIQLLLLQACVTSNQ